MGKIPFLFMLLEEVMASWEMPIFTRWGRCIGHLLMESMKYDIGEMNHNVSKPLSFFNNMVPSMPFPGPF